MESGLLSDFREHSFHSSARERSPGLIWGPLVKRKILCEEANTMRHEKISSVDW